LGGAKFGIEYIWAAPASSDGKVYLGPYVLANGSNSGLAGHWEPLPRLSETDHAAPLAVAQHDAPLALVHALAHHGAGDGVGPRTLGVLDDHRPVGGVGDDVVGDDPEDVP
jgi:hypothetical protein